MTKSPAGNAAASGNKAHKLAIMEGVREYRGGWSVELWRNALGRLVIRAFGQDRKTYAEIDAMDLLNWVVVTRIR